MLQLYNSPLSTEIPVSASKLTTFSVCKHLQIRKRCIAKYRHSSSNDNTVPHDYANSGTCKINSVSIQMKAGRITDM